MQQRGKPWFHTYFTRWMNPISRWAILLIAKNQSSDSALCVHAVKYNFSYKSRTNSRRIFQQTSILINYDTCRKQNYSYFRVNIPIPHWWPLKFGSGDLKFKTAFETEKYLQKENKNTKELLITKYQKNAKIDIEDKFSTLKRFWCCESQFKENGFELKLCLNYLYLRIIYIETGSCALH